MGEVEVVLALEHVVGELVAERVADAARAAAVVDQVEHRDLGLLAAVEREARHRERLARGGDDAAVALVEPFGRHARPAGLGLAALDAEAEHLHRIAELGHGLALHLMHRIARLGAADVGEPGAGDQAMRRVGVVERRQQAAFGLQRGERLLAVDRRRGRDLGEPAAALQGAARELVDAADAAQRLRRAAVLADPADPAPLVRRDELYQPHACLPRRRCCLPQCPHPDAAPPRSSSARRRACKSFAAARVVDTVGLV